MTHIRYMYLQKIEMHHWRGSHTIINKSWVYSFYNLHCKPNLEHVSLSAETQLCKRMEISHNLGINGQFTRK